MELQKKQIHRNRMGRSIVTQFVVDNDYNVPDAKNDIAQIIMSEGKVRVDELKPMEQYVRVKGWLDVRVLYATENETVPLDFLSGQIPFEEMIYVEEKEIPYILRDTKVEINTGMIHSRKISIKAMCEVEISSEEEQLAVFTVDVEAEEKLYKRKKDITLLKLCVSKRDHYRIKEEMQLPGTKESIGTLLWTDISTRKIDTKLEEGELLLTGELLVFCFYESPDGKLDWVEQIVPYQGQVECPEAIQGRYHYVNSRLEDVTTEVCADEDGEMRVLGIEGVLELRFAVYEEEEMKLLEDVYALATEYETATEMVTYEEPVLQNHSKCKLTERLTLPELKDDILQICHSNGMVQIENSMITEEGILVEGVLHISFLYVKTDDKTPFGVWQGMIPFRHIIASPETGEDLKYDITNAVEQLSISLLGGESVEVKGVLAFHSFLRREKQLPQIVDMKPLPLENQKNEKRPSIVGYIVREGDDLWNLAKRYQTTVEGLCEMNQLADESLKTGQRILILKENMGIL